MASEKGNQYAQMTLGYIYMGSGFIKRETFAKEGVDQNISEAVRFFKMASEKGNQDAHMTLGYIYETDIYKKKDIYEAIKFFEMAAGKSNVNALMKLGFIYRNGENGQEKDISKAIKHFEIAAGKGNVPALMELADIYTYGEGVEKNYQTALEYYNNVLYRRTSPQSSRLESIRMRRQIYFLKVLIMSLINNKKLEVKLI